MKLGNTSWDVSTGPLSLDVDEFNDTLANLTILTFNITTAPTVAPCPTTDPEYLRHLKIITLSVIGLVGFLIVGCLLLCMCYKNDRFMASLPWRKKDDGDQPFVYKMTVDSINLSGLAAIGMGTMEMGKLDTEENVPENEEVGAEEDPGGGAKETDGLLQEYNIEAEVDVNIGIPQENVPATVEFSPFMDHYHNVQIPSCEGEPIEFRAEASGEDSDCNSYVPDGVKAVKEWLAKTPSGVPRVSVKRPKKEDLTSEPAERDSLLLQVPDRVKKARQPSRRDRDNHVTFASQPASDELAPRGREGSVKVRRPGQITPPAIVVGDRGTTEVRDPLPGLLVLPEDTVLRLSPALFKSKRPLLHPAESDVSSLASEPTDTGDIYSESEEDEPDFDTTFQIPRKYKKKDGHESELIMAPQSQDVMNVTGRF